MDCSRLSAIFSGCLLLLAAGSPAHADVGTIQYDTGVFSFGSTLDGRTWGNRFDQAVGLNTFIEPVLATGTVSRVDAYMSYAGGSGFRVSVFGPVSGTAAPLLGTGFAATSGSGWKAFTFPVPVTHTGGDFLVGVFARSVGPPDYLGFDTGTRLGQGLHGVALNPLGTALAPVNGNAMLRVTGNLLPPEFTCGLIEESALVKPKVKLKFNKVSRDGWSLKVKNWMLPGGTVAAGQTATVSVGGNAVTGLLDAKGRFKGQNESIKLKQARSGQWKLSAKRSKRDLAGDFTDEGLVDEDNAKPGKAVIVGVNVDLDGACWEINNQLAYRSKLGKSGTAKLP